jgi:hypothetical protein
MPTDWLWPFQLNQYELPFMNNSHRIAWGSTYGAIGQRSITTFGRMAVGYPTLSYSVFIVLGLKSTQTTRSQVTQVERLTAAQVSASLGGPASYDPTFSVWRVPMAGNQVTVTFNAAGGPVTAPSSA